MKEDPHHNGPEAAARSICVCLALLAVQVGVCFGFYWRFGTLPPAIQPLSSLVGWADRDARADANVTASARLRATVETLFASAARYSDTNEPRMFLSEASGCKSLVAASAADGEATVARTGLRSPLRVVAAAECERGLLSGTKSKEVDRIIERDRVNAYYWAVCLASLPWLIGGAGLLYALRARQQVSKTAPASQLFLASRKNWVKLSPALMSAAFVAFCTGAGWACVLNPYGGVAADALSFLRSHPLYPVAFESILVWESPRTFHVAAGFLGWYAGFALNTLFRLWKRDVLGVRVFPFFVQKFVIVMSTAVALSVFDSDYAAAAVFAVGSFPRAGWMLLREAGIQKFRKADDGLQEISALSGVSWWQLARLDDEGIDSASELVRRTRDDFAYLQQTLPADMKDSLPRWQREAVLIEALGLPAFQKIRPFYDEPHRLRDDLKMGAVPAVLFLADKVDAAEWKKLSLELSHNLHRYIDDAMLVPANTSASPTASRSPLENVENDNGARKRKGAA